MKQPEPDKPMFDERLTEALLEAQAAVSPTPERARALRERVLESVRQIPRHATPAEHLTIRDGEAGWTILSPGVSMKLLNEDTATRTYLLRLAAGIRLPGHEHTLDEECMVLEGEVWLGDLQAQAGDYHLARRGLPHGEVYTETGCLLFLRGQKHYAEMGGG